MALHTVIELWLCVYRSRCKKGSGCDSGPRLASKRHDRPVNGLRVVSAQLLSARAAKFGAGQPLARHALGLRPMLRPAIATTIGLSISSTPLAKFRERCPTLGNSIECSSFARPSCNSKNPQTLNSAMHLQLVANAPSACGAENPPKFEFAREWGCNC